MTDRSQSKRNRDRHADSRSVLFPEPPLNFNPGRLTWLRDRPEGQLILNQGSDRALLARSGSLHAPCPAEQSPGSFFYRRQPLRRLLAGDQGRRFFDGGCDANSVDSASLGSRALSSAGPERLPYKQKVAGSNPAAPIGKTSSYREWDAQRPRVAGRRVCALALLDGDAAHSTFTAATWSACVSRLSSTNARLSAPKPRRK